MSKRLLICISYLRTDSTRVSKVAEDEAREYIFASYGEQYASKADGSGKNRSNVQDAHEAIRPTSIARTPVKIKESLSRDQFRLYKLIWERFAASRMTSAVYETMSVKIKIGKHVFNVSTSKIKFDGFLCVYNADEADSKDKKNVMLKSLDENSKLKLVDIQPAQHFTQPPAHYTEASLVKALEEHGIGRPSTYAPTISVLLARRYITKEQKNLYITEIGEVVNSIMKDSFATIVDEQFTANMEHLLDKIEEGAVDWKMVVKNFYPDLATAVEKAEKELEKIEIKDEETDVICENCGRNMVIKYGPHGRFLACPGFPDCKNTKPYYEKIGVSCPKCGSDVVLKMTKKGRRYYGCVNNPECDFMSWAKPVSTKCPKCGGYMVEKGSKIVCADQNCKTIIEK